MAETKADLLKKAEELNIEVDSKATIAQIKELLESANENSDTDKQQKEAETEEKTAAKAGKRSAKALREVEEKEAKEARKESNEQSSAAVKRVKPTRPRIERQGKHLRESYKNIEKGKAYTLAEAVQLAKTTSKVKFDATVEMHINLQVDPRHADQNVRDNLVLPAGTGKKVKIAVFTDDTKAAKDTGADMAGNEEFLAELEKGKADFDILITTPQMMPKLARYARFLGPKGLMPNPKSGTVTTDISKAIAEAKAGRVEYRVDANGIVHLGVGKVSFEDQALMDNITAVMASIKSNKPASLKGIYLRSAVLSTSMGPSITLDTSSL